MVDKGTSYAVKTVAEPGKFSMKEDLKIFFNLGSTAGAGSGDFHTYRKLRAREIERLKQMDDEWDNMEAKVGFEMRKQQAEDELQAKRDKARTKRQRKKEKLRAGKKLKKLQSKNKFKNDGDFMAQFLAAQAAEGGEEKKEGDTAAKEGDSVTKEDSKGGEKPEKAKGEEDLKQSAEDEIAKALAS